MQGSVTGQGELREGGHSNADHDNWWWRQLDWKAGEWVRCISSFCFALPLFCPDLIYWHRNSRPWYWFSLHLVWVTLWSSWDFVPKAPAWWWFSCLLGSGAAKLALISPLVVPGLVLSSLFLPFPFTQMSNKRSNSFRQAILQGNRRLCSKALLEETGLSLSQRLIRHVAYETLPREIDRKWYYDSYTCCPPPWFMITITIVEASTLRTHPTLPKALLQHKQELELDSFRSRQGQARSWLILAYLNVCV